MLAPQVHDLDAAIARGFRTRSIPLRDTAARTWRARRRSAGGIGIRRSPASASAPPLAESRPAIGGRAARCLTGRPAPAWLTCDLRPLGGPLGTVLQGTAGEEDRQEHVDRVLRGECFRSCQLIGYLEREACPAERIEVGAERAVMVAHAPDAFGIRGSPEPLSQIVTHQPCRQVVRACDGKPRERESMDARSRRRTNHLP